jgi:hypothetical protein
MRDYQDMADELDTEKSFLYELAREFKQQGREREAIRLERIAQVMEEVYFYVPDMQTLKNEIEGLLRR